MKFPTSVREIVLRRHVRRFVKLVPDFLMCLESKRGDPPCTPRLFGPLVLRAQKELNKSLEDGHRKKIALFVRLLFFSLGWVLVTQKRSYIHVKSCEIM